MVTGSAIGGAIRAIREEKGLTQGDVVRQMRKNGKEVERSFLSAIETGKVRYPRLDTLASIVSALGVKRLGALILYIEAENKIPIEYISKKIEEATTKYCGAGGCASR